MALLFLSTYRIKQKLAKSCSFTILSIRSSRFGRPMPNRDPLRK